MTNPEIDAEQPRRKRLEPVTIAPFHRAQAITTASVYWIGGFTFPMPFRVRQWFLAFLTKLKAELTKRGLRQENFLRFKVVARHETERFLATSREYKPLAGYALPPGGGTVKAPTSEDIEKAIQNGGFKLEDWIGDYTYWFLRKHDERQQQDFFGMGGMILLWLEPDSATVPPELDMPEVAQAYLAESGTDMAGTLQELYSLQDGFLEKSKQRFGSAMRDDPSFEGLPFVLPYLEAKHFTAASPETLSSWFEVFDGYLIESPADAGVLLAFKDPSFDEVLCAALLALSSDGVEWPIENKAGALA